MSKATRWVALGVMLATPFACAQTAQAGLLSTVTTKVTTTVATAPATVQSTVSGVTSTLTPTAGTTQLTNAVSSLVAGGNTTATAAQAVVQGFTATVDPTIASSVDSLKARADATVAAAKALDTNAANEQLMGAVADLQGQAMGEVGSLTGVALTQALTNGLTIAQQVLSPVCSVLGTPVALAQGVGVDLQRFTPVAPGIEPLDAATNKLLTDTYSSLYDAILNDVTSQLGPAGAAAAAVLTLLKFNYTSTYYPPNGGTPVQRTTKALLDVPTPIDVDGSGGYDLCATTTLALDATSGQVKLTQQIAKLPLAKAVLPVDISGALLGVIGFGYETKDSTAPTNFTSNIALGSGPELLTLDNTYTVFRGQTLTLPPLTGATETISLNQPPLTIGSLTIPRVLPLTEPAPTPKITQVIGIGGSALALKFRHENEPGVTSVGVGLTNGLKVRYGGSADSDAFGFTTAIGTIGLGVKATPAGKSFSSCAGGLLGGAAVCDTGPATGPADVASLSFSSSRTTKFDSFQTILGGDGTTCSATIPTFDAHVTGKGLSTGISAFSTTASSGKGWIDTDGPVSGCLAVGNAVNGLYGDLTDGFQATKRSTAFHSTEVFGFTTGFVPDAKSGSAACSAGSALKATKLALKSLAVDIGGVFCAFPPANTAAPVANGQALIDATLTAGNGTWTPGAPNTPAFSYEWLRCDAAGGNCAPVPGGTANTHFLDYGDGVSGGNGSDLGHTFRVKVTATNFDGTASATSAATAVVQLPPPPINTARPAITAVTPPGAPFGVGRPVRTSNGTWSNGVLSYGYQWLRCDEDGTGCAPIAGATSAQYTPVAADMGHQLSVTVTATNHGGVVSATANSGPFIPPPPVNTAAPGIGNGAANALGQGVLTGDALTARNGTWKYATSFAYSWLRCDASGDGCAPIGVTTGGYTATSDDIGSTLRVAVTATNIDGSTTQTTAPTGVVALNDLEIRQPAAVADGTVNAIAPSGHGTSFVGGSFDTAGAPTGGSAVVGGGLAALGGSPSAASQTQGGPVKAVAGDGAGGYYLGGGFTKVLGQPCAGFAHITAAGALDGASCRAGLVGEVRAVDVSNGLVAIGGDFTLAGRQNLAFVSTSDQSTLFGEGDPNGPVNAIVNDSGTSSNIYVGGAFTQYNGQPAAHLLKLAVAAGPVIGRAPWLGGVARCAEAIGTACTTDSANVYALRFVKTTVSLVGAIPVIAVGGEFDRTLVSTSGAAGQVARNNVAAIGTAPSGSLGATAGWNPNANGAVRAIATPNPTPATNAAVTVYLGGDFTQFGSNVIGHVGQFGMSALIASSSSGTGATSGPTTNWKPALDDGSVTALVADATGVWVGGSFTSVGGVVRHRLAAFKPAGTAGGVTAAEAWDPNAGRTVHALAKLSTGQLAVGGRFTVVGGATRVNLAEIGPLGLTGWNPGADGPVRALASASGGVVAGGEFTHVAGAARAHLASIDDSGAATGWNPGADGTVKALAVDSSGTVYAGGTFAHAGGAERARLAALDASGAATAWNPGADGDVNALALNGGDVLAGGSFANAGGAARLHLAEIDGSGAATSFDVPVDGTDVRALAVNSGVAYLGGSFASVGGQVRGNAAAIDLSDDSVTAFDPAADRPVDAVLPSGSSVFLGGSFTRAGGADRANAAQVANDTGLAKSFSPDPDGAVRALGVSSTGSILLGGEFTSAAGSLTPGLARFGG